MTQPFGPAIWSMFLLLGGSLLFSVLIVYGRRATVADDVLFRGLVIAGWLCILLGCVGLASLMLGPWSFVLAGMTIVVTIVGVGQYRAAQRRTLLSALAIGVERSVPLDRIANSVAQHGAREMRFRATMLSSLLQAGLPLPEALERSKHRLGVGEAVSLRVGYENGSLETCLRWSSDDEDRTRRALRAMVERYVYLGWLFVVGMSVVVFFMLKIVPVFNDLFGDFGIELPSTMRWLTAFSDTFIGYWFLLSPLLLLLWGLFLVGVLSYFGWLPQDFPFLGRVALPMDRIHVLRGLGSGVRRNRPVCEIIDRLAQLYPRQRVRWRLGLAGSAVRNGREWTDALLTAGLLRKPDAAVLRSAERVGNLAWALEELASTRMRRLTYRLMVWFNGLFPVLILLYGAVVLLISHAVMASLIGLVEALA